VAQLPALDLTIAGITRPFFEGISPGELLGAEPEDQETSVVVEGLEAGVTYSWRLRLLTTEGLEVSEPVSCQAPVCPADLQEGP
jgi:hypothetical protein